jgi:hypothetical protein
LEVGEAEACRSGSSLPSSSDVAVLHINDVGRRLLR